MSVDLKDLAIGSIVAEHRFGPLSRDDLALYAKASGDSNPLHLDPAFAKQAGFDDVIVHGMLGMALLGRLLTDHFAVESIRGLSSRFAATIPVGQAIVCRATLDKLDGDVAALNLEARSEDGATSFITGTATIAL